MAANNNLSSSSPWFSSSSSRRASPIPTWRQQQQHVATTTLICSRSSASVATSDKKSNYSSRERSPLAHTERRVVAVNGSRGGGHVRGGAGVGGSERACCSLVTERAPASPFHQLLENGHAVIVIARIGCRSFASGQSVMRG